MTAALPDPDAVDVLLAAGLDARPRPLFAGAVCGVDLAGQTLLRSRGWAYRYADQAGTLLPAERCRPVTDDTVFDLASLTKLFTATVVLQLVGQGRLGLDDRVGRRLPSWTDRDRAEVTVRQLLTHTSGLPAETAAWRDHDTREARRAAVLAERLEAPPGTRVRYSCVGYLTLGMLAEHLLGHGLDEAVEDLVCRPVGLDHTRFRPLDRPEPGQARPALGVRDTIAATEMRRITWSPDHDPADPDPRGVVHDETAAALGGVAGNAGLFGPARDLLAFGRALLDALATDHNRLGLPAGLVRQLVSPQLPPELDPGYRSGLGFRIDDPTFMGRLSGGGCAYGHTGFTGTSLVLDERRDLVVVLLSNRVHPSRSWSELNPMRRRLAALVA